MVLIRSIIHLVQKPLDVFIISLTTPVEPAAFRILTPLISAATSSSEIRQQGPITSGQSSSPSLPFSTFYISNEGFWRRVFVRPDALPGVNHMCGSDVILGPHHKVMMFNIDQEYNEDYFQAHYICTFVHGVS